MQRRTEPRVAAALPVDLWSDGRLLGRFITFDVSRGGLGFDPAAAEVALPVRALVQANVRLDGECHRFTAVLQHAGGGRAGLLFADDADVLWGTLLEHSRPLAAA